MKKKVYKILRLLLVIIFWAGLQSAQAAGILVTDAHTPFIEDPLCKCNTDDCSGVCPDPCGRQYIYQAFDVSQDVAFNGGDAQNAVVSGTIEGNSAHGCPFSLIHRPEFINDGYYGNGSSWIANSNSWLKIDLGKEILINRVKFGRERIVTNEDPFNDRDPGQFILSVASYENTYIDGDENNDINEYLEIVNSQDYFFSGFVNGPETVEVSFEPVLARYVKIKFFNYGVAIDEVEIMMARPSLSCLGFEAPFGMPLELKRKVKRTIPLKMQLFDGITQITNADVVAPVINVYFIPEIGNGQDLTDELEPRGAAHEGNAFRYNEDSGYWVYNLGTKQYSTAGKYTVTVTPGDESYTINPTCEQYFILLP